MKRMAKNALPAIKHPAQCRGHCLVVPCNLTKANHRERAWSLNLDQSRASASFDIIAALQAR